MGWISDAPRRSIAIVEPATIEFEGNVYPAIAFGFTSPDEAHRDISAMFVGREPDLRRLQRQIDKAITDALRQVRARRQARSHERLRRRPDVARRARVLARRIQPRHQSHEVLHPSPLALSSVLVAHQGKARAMNRSEMPPRKSYIRRVSAKRRARWPARLKAMEVVRERDKVCQFEPLLAAWQSANPGVRFPAPLPTCFGPLEGHEPLKRSHGADETDPQQIVLVCRGANGWVEDYPNARKLLGL